MNPAAVSSESDSEKGYESPPLMTSQEFLDHEKEKEIVDGILKRIMERKKFVANVKQMMRAKALRDHDNKEKIGMERRNCFKNQLMLREQPSQESKISHQSQSQNSHRNEDHQEYRRGEKREYDSRSRSTNGQRREEQHRSNSYRERENRDRHHSTRPSRSTNGYEQKEKERDHDNRRSSNTRSRWSSSNKDNEFNDKRSQSQSTSTKRRREDEAGSHQYYRSSGSNGEMRDITISRNERERERQGPGCYENQFNSRVGYFIDNQRSNESDDLSRSSNINHALSVQRSLSEIRRFGSRENRSYTANGTRNGGGGIRSGNGTQSDYELSYRSTQYERKDMPNSQQSSQQQQFKPKRAIYTSHYYNAMLQKQRDSYSRPGRYFRPN